MPGRRIDCLAVSAGETASAFANLLVGQLLIGAAQEIFLQGGVPLVGEVEEIPVQGDVPLNYPRSLTVDTGVQLSGLNDQSIEYYLEELS